MESFMKEFEHLKIQLEDIKKATNNFSDKHIGSGGFGKVYQGELCHYKGQSMAAIKRLDRRFGQGESEFWKEIMMLSRYTHQNLIPLLGFCDEGGEKILVYKHASNGSLDRHLGSSALTWTHRLKICLDTARGLTYLHDHKGSQQRVIHRDIKSSNILLDHNWNAKVADFGLSKIGPANQQHTDFITNVVGTLGYLDPNYMEMGLLTKESDVYSFGVVLFEVLCGRLCYQFSNGQIFVHIWKKHYEEKKLDMIIFKNMKPMNPTSLETFSEIAYQCLQRPSKERPTMAHIVEKLEIALEFQVCQDLERPKEYEDIFKAATPPLIYRSLDELNVLLSKGVLLNGGKTWVSLNMKGERCEMISIAQCLIPSTSTKSRYLSTHNSRFQVGCYEPFKQDLKLETHVITQFLSPLITYSVNLVFKNKKRQQCIGLEYKLNGGKTFYSFLSDEREDGWLRAELFQFTSDDKIVDLNIWFDLQYCKKLLVEGIEFQPLEKVEHEVLIDEKVDMQASDTYFKEKLETRYDGKNYLMLPTRAVLEEKRWKPLSETRFEDMGHGSSREFVIFCDIESKVLSQQTTYAAYLIYKQEGSFRSQPPPAQVEDINSNSEIWHFYFGTPQSPVITKGMVDKHNYKPSRRLKIKGLPQQRSDGWMEVQVWEFNTGNITGRIPMNLKLSSYDKALEGIEVRGIEFRPV